MSNCVPAERLSADAKCLKDPPSPPVQENMGVLKRFLRFSPLGSKTDVQVPQSNKEKEDPLQIFYGVYIPCEAKIGEDAESLHVYKEKEEALKVVKKYKKARFKAFKNREDAVLFALHDVDLFQDKSSAHSQGDGPSGLEGSQGSPLPVIQLAGGERPSQFKGPKPQEMVQFRKCIEGGDLDTVKKTIWDNPRYLISSGDTPSILQEGSRYNALHVAVKAMNVQMCDILLATISEPHFVQLLFGDDNIENSKARASVLLDLYLNMPDKAMNETPLHFASKFGAKEIVDLLVSYPQCSRTVLNKFKEQPKDVICQRCKTSEAGLNSEIARLLRDRFYVPVLHSEDSTRQPVIGEPFSPGSPPRLNSDPISPRLEIRAFAGPMEKEEALTFRKKWKTPPRSVPISLNGNSTPLLAARFRLKDVEKGLETVGRDLAQECKIGWKEYWPFLDTFTDLTSQEGLGLLEDFLKNKYTAQWQRSTTSLNFPDSFQASPKTPVDDVFQDFTVKETKKEIIDTGLSPMSDLCLQLKSCILNDNQNQYKSNSTRPIKIPDARNCQTVPEDDAVVNPFINPGLSPYLCIEKSCQVFAKRIGFGLSRSLLTEAEMIIECFKSETKHLQQTVASYMDDPRFYTVDFHLVHSRVAQLIAQKLLSDVKFADDLEALKSSLREVSHLNDKNVDAFSSDEDETVAATYRMNKEMKEVPSKKNKSVNAQIKCLAESILRWLSEIKNTASCKALKLEEECIDVWADLYRCHCPWQTEVFFRNCRKNASLKRSQIKSRDGCDALSSSPKSSMELVSRRLKFESDLENGENSNKGKGGTQPLGSSPKSDRNHNFPSSTRPRTTSSSNDPLPDLEGKPEEVAKQNGNHATADEGEITSDEDFNSDDDGDEKFLTPVSTPSPTFESSGESDYEEANDGTLLQPDGEGFDAYIQGEKPSKIDRAVYEAIKNCNVDRVVHPNVYRWRHTISLVPQEERENWPAVDPESPDDVDAPISCSFNIGHISHFRTSTPSKVGPVHTLQASFTADRFLPSPKNGTVFNPIALLTPLGNISIGRDQSRSEQTVPMQVSKWLRVTGPNSPRSALANNNFRPNVSFGF